MRKTWIVLCLALAFCLSLSPLCHAEEDAEPADAYLYRLENGTPKYWLDLTGAMADMPVLHCFFRSGDPTFYEEIFFLDPETAVTTADGVRYRRVTDRYGMDRSAWFKELTLRTEGDRLAMTVVRDERTLAGGVEDNILSGRYEMSAAGAGLVYEYRRDDGQLKYWLVRDEEGFKLHCRFLSGDPTPYEEIFLLDAGSAESDGAYTLSFRKVLHQTGADVSFWFESLTLTEVQGAFLLNVKRDESTLAGGAEDNILTGVYLFEPHTYSLPAHAGPFMPEELGEWAQIYYFRHFGYFPPEAEVEQNTDGSFSIHLYEIVGTGEAEHTATAAWYTVDADGNGSDDITGDSVSLCG